MSEKAGRSTKKRGSVSSTGSHAKDSISTVSYMDEPGHHDDMSRRTLNLGNTYQLAPARHFPVTEVQEILEETLSSTLQEEKYDPELCKNWSKTISDMVKTRVKALTILRYKIVVIVSIGHIGNQDMLIGSRCLWDVAHDTFSSYTFKNSSLYAVATVYCIYFE